MSPIRYILRARDDETATSSTTPEASASSSSSPYPTEFYGIPRFIPWLAVVLLASGVLALLLFCVKRRRPVGSRTRPVRRAPTSLEKPRSSSEMLLHPGWEKHSSLITAPPPAYTAAGDNAAPGQEDAVFKTTRNQRRALYVMYKPLARAPSPPPPFWW